MTQTNNTSPFGDKRTALAFFLSLIVIIAYTELLLKPDEPRDWNASRNGVDSSAKPTSANQPLSGAERRPGPVPAQSSPDTEGSSISLPEKAGNEPPSLTQPTLAEIEAAPSTTVKTSLFEAEISHLGGQLLHFSLNEHTETRAGEERYDLVRTAAPLAPEGTRADAEPAILPFQVELLGGSDSGILFPAPATSQGATSAGTLSLGDGETVQLSFQIPLETGGTYTKKYRFSGGTYFIGVEAELSNPPAAALPLRLGWSSYIPEEIATSSYDPVSFSFFLPNDKVEHSAVTELEPLSGKQEHVARWSALGDKYFMASLLATGESDTMVARRNASLYSLQVVGDASQVATKAYLGPKNYSELKALNSMELHRSVNFGFFAFLAIPLLTVINLCYAMLGNYGLAIILLTLLIKLAFLPLTQVSLKSMKAMQDLQPEIKALRERVKDPTQLNQEMFALYKRKGVNPMGGCLPMLIQIPVFLGLYNALLNATELRHAPFALWINDLSAPEALHLFGIPVPVMIILMGLSMFFQQWLMPSNMDEQQKKVMLFMPVVFTIMFIVFPFPSGLVLYWLVNNLISIVQQVYLRTERNVGPLQATLVASAAIFVGGFGLTLIPW
ncbi:membrane protein insertase YidC [bacterium]|nr:membrane protein insertase YidC [bacterium]